jgi:copper chaperone
MTKTTLKIDGMMCGMCESHVNDAIRQAFKVKKVTSSHSKGECEIISEEPLDEAKLQEVMEPTGYKLLSVEAAPYEKKGLFGFGK